jgi:hypothetical protein
MTFRRGLVSRALFAPNSKAILYSATWDGETPRTFLKLPESTSLDRSLEADPQIPMAYTEDGSQALVVLGPVRISNYLNGTLAVASFRGKPRLVSKFGWADWARHTVLRLCAKRAASGASNTKLRQEPRAHNLRTAGGISFLRFSPHEDSVAFFHHSSTGDPAGEVRIATADGKSSRPLTPRFAFCRGLAWNAKTGKSNYVAYRDELLAGDPDSDLIESTSHDALIEATPFFRTSPRGDLCLLTSSENRTALMLRRRGGHLQDFFWFNQTFVTDISPDGKSLLFYDGGLEVPFGSWIRSVDGGDAVRLGEWDVPKFSPDGKWIVALTPNGLGPPQILLHPNGPGETRQLTSPPASHSAPSFAGTRTILFVRVQGDSKEIWRMETDGTGRRRLAVACDSPVANRAADAFVCVRENHRSLFAYPIKGEQGRLVYELPAGEQFRYAGWSDQGDRILAVTSKGRILELSASGSALLSEDQLLLPGSETNSTVFAAALSERGAVRPFP